MTSLAGGAAFAADDDAAKLRKLFFQRDYESAIVEGDKLGAATTDRHELKAWYLLNVARTDDIDRAVESAKQMVDAAPESGWPGSLTPPHSVTGAHPLPVQAR